MQPEKGQYPRLNRYWLALALLVVTAMLTAGGPARAGGSESSRVRTDPALRAEIATGTSSYTRPNTTTTPGGSDATRLAGDGQPATPFPDGALPSPVTI